LLSRSRWFTSPLSSIYCSNASRSPWKCPAQSC